MFRVFVEKEGVQGLFAGTKAGDKANTYLVSVADYDAAPDSYEEYSRIEVANEKADWCRKKGWTATVVNESGNVAA